MADGVHPTYAVFSLRCGTTFLIAGVLNRDSLLSIDRLAGDKVLGRKKIFLSAAGNEYTLVTMGLNDDLLAALCASCTTTTTSATASATGRTATTTRTSTSSTARGAASSSS